MTAPNLWLEALFTVGAAACNGLLAQRCAARETLRPGDDAAAEADVPVAWRVQRPDNRGAPDLRRTPEANPQTPTTHPNQTTTAPTPPTPPNSAPGVPPTPGAPTPATPILVFTRTLTTWDGTTSPTRSAPPVPPPTSPISETKPGPTPASSEVATPRPTSAANAEPEVTSSPDTAPPQLELDFSPRPTSKPEAEPPASSGTGEPPQLGVLLASVVRILDDVVGQAVGEAVADAFTRLQQSHTRDLYALAERFDAALERQDARTRELLERQDERLRDLLASQARTHAEELRAMLRETSSHPATSERASSTALAAIPEALEELQETLRLGFGEVRSALDRNNHELTKLRAELALLAQISVLRRPEPEVPIRVTSNNASPALPPHTDVQAVVSGISGPAGGVPRAAPARSPPTREDRAATQRRFDAVHDDDIVIDDTIADPPHHPLRYRPPDDAAETSYTQEASA